jgi:hypothetical protein
MDDAQKQQMIRDMIFDLETAKDAMKEAVFDVVAHLYVTRNAGEPHGLTDDQLNQVMNVAREFAELGELYDRAEEIRIEINQAKANQKQEV